MARVLGAVVSIAVVAAVAWPLGRDPSVHGSDDFPLSTYPMFARPRSTRMSMSYAVGIAGVERRFLPPRLLGSREALQAKALIDRAVGAGLDAQAALCHAIAARVAAEDELGDVREVALVRGDHDAVELLVYGRRGAETEHVRCAVPR